MAEFTRAFRVQGMDSRATPRFQMVPAGGKRFVILRDGVGATVVSLDTGVCKVTEVQRSNLPADDRAPFQPNDRFFRLDAGATAGTTFLLVNALSSGSFLPIPLMLEIGVKTKREQLVTFNFVRDNAGHATNRPQADVAKLMPTAQFVWRVQANVHLITHNIRSVKVNQNLGPTVTLPAGQLGATGQAIEAVGATGVDLNVFFVKDLQESGNTDDVDAVTTIGRAGTGTPGVCIFEDNAGSGQGLSLAHEIGHHLGLLHDGHTNKLDLMFPTTGERGLNLSREDVNIANP